MWTALGITTAPLATLLAAKLAPDEVELYPKFFFWVSLFAVIVASCVLFFEGGLWLSLSVLSLGLYAYGLSIKSTALVAISAGILATSSDIIVLELLFVALFLSTAYLISQRVRTLWWFLLTPIIIIVSTFLL